MRLRLSPLEARQNPSQVVQFWSTHTCGCNHQERCVHTGIEPAHLELGKTACEDQNEAPVGHSQDLLEAFGDGPVLVHGCLDTFLIFSNDLARLAIMAKSSVKLEISPSLGHRYKVAPTTASAEERICDTKATKEARRNPRT
jgi:hypothetical protein